MQIFKEGVHLWGRVFTMTDRFYEAVAGAAHALHTICAAHTAWKRD